MMARIYACNTRINSEFHAITFRYCADACLDAIKAFCERLNRGEFAGRKVCGRYRGWIVEVTGTQAADPHASFRYPLQVPSGRQGKRQRPELEYLGPGGRDRYLG